VVWVSEIRSDQKAQPGLLDTHAAVARILHVSGKAEYRVLRRFFVRNVDSDSDNILRIRITRLLNMSSIVNCYRFAASILNVKIHAQDQVVGTLF
jgi:hypothetical protein